jgi:hypothetical protein
LRVPRLYSPIVFATFAALPAFVVGFFIMIPSHL